MECGTYITRTQEYKSVEISLTFLSFIGPELWLSKLMRKKNIIFKTLAVIQTLITLLLSVTEHLFVCRIEAHEELYNFYSIQYVATKSNKKILSITLWP